MLQAMHEFLQPKKERLIQQDKHNKFLKKHLKKANEIDSMLVSPNKKKETQK